MQEWQHNSVGVRCVSAALLTQRSTHNGMHHPFEVEAIHLSASLMLHRSLARAPALHLPVDLSLVYVFLAALVELPATR